MTQGTMKKIKEVKEMPRHSGNHRRWDSRLAEEVQKTSESKNLEQLIARVFSSRLCYVKKPVTA